MPTDNTQLNAGTGGNTLRTLADGSSIEWPAAVCCYATTVSPGANVLQVVTPSTGMPIAITDGTHTAAITSGGALKVDASATTQPVSGTVAISGTVAVASVGGSVEITNDVGNPIPVSGTVAVSGTVPVSGTFWQATQPVSGTVSAAQSGTWNLGTVTAVTTVSAVTSITNALPAGTNLLGQVAAGQQVAALYNGASAVTPVTAAINVSASGNTTIVAGVAGKRVYVLRWSIKAGGATTLAWQDSAAAALSGPRPQVLGGSDGGAYCPASIYQTGVGQGLVLNLSAAAAIGGELTYCQF